MNPSLSLIPISTHYNFSVTSFFLLGFSILLPVPGAGRCSLLPAHIHGVLHASLQHGSANFSSRFLTGTALGINDRCV